MHEWLNSQVRTNLNIKLRLNLEGIRKVLKKYGVCIHVYIYVQRRQGAYVYMYTHTYCFCVWTWMNVLCIYVHMYMYIYVYTDVRAYSSPLRGYTVPRKALNKCICTCIYINTGSTLRAFVRRSRSTTKSWSTLSPSSRPNSSILSRRNTHFSNSATSSSLFLKNVRKLYSCLFYFRLF